MVWIYPKEILTISKDIAPAQWISEGLRPMSLSSPEFLPVVAGLIPEVFERYARILHPAKVGERRGDEPEFVTWNSIAERNGKIMHPLVEFGCIENPPNRSHDNVPGSDHPLWDGLEKEPFHDLVGVLARYTSTSDTCWFCQWEGNGSFATGSSVRYGRPDTTVDFVAEAEYREAPRVEAMRRKYILFTGKLSAGNAFHEWLFSQSPHIMWPDDRAWIVATELDLRSTYVGGSEACIEAILNHPGLETFEAKPEYRIFSGSDTINC